MEKILKVTNHKKQAIEDRLYWRSLSYEDRLDALEKLRIEAGKFLYEYPGRLQRIIKVTGKAQR